MQHEIYHADARSKSVKGEGTCQGDDQIEEKTAVDT